MRAPAEKNGTESRRAYLEKLARGHSAAHKARAQKELDAEPPIPEALEYLWDTFLTLDRGRRYGMNGPEPLTFVDVAAGDRLMLWSLEPHEVEALFTLDAFVRSPDADKDE